MDDHLKPLALGRTGYEAYAEFTDGKTFDGRDMPAWDDLGEIQIAWAMAAGAIYHAVLTPPSGGMQ